MISPLKRLLPLLLLLPTLAWGATYYVDGSCTNNGDGTAVACAASPGGVGAKNTVYNGLGTDGISKLTASGDILNIRSGVYTENDEMRVQGKTNVTIQGYQSERPIFDGMGAVSWTQCTDCSAISAQTFCQNAPGTCSDYWFYTGTGNHSKAMWASKIDGTPTFRVSSIAAMTNATAGYIGTTCHTPWTWIVCRAASDCPNSVACDGSTPEVDSFNANDQTNGSTLLVRWAAQTKGPVVFDNNGFGFSVCNSTGVTFKNMDMRLHRRPAFQIGDTGNGGCTGFSSVTIDNVTGTYNIDHGGSGHDVTGNHASTLTVTNSFFAYSTDESIHTDDMCKAAECVGAGNPCNCCTGAGTGPTCTGATVLTVQHNFLRDQGDCNVLGPWQCPSTPEGMTISSSNSASTTGSGDYTGSVISDNYILRPQKHGTILENSCSNLSFHDNIIDSPQQAGLRIACDNTLAASAISANSIYNNLIINPDSGNFSRGGIDIEQSQANCVVQNNLIYNNTVVEPQNTGSRPLKFAITTDANVTGNLIRNNILSTTLGQKAVDTSGTTSTTNKLEFNLIRTSANPAIAWLGSTYTCALLSTAGTGNVNNCPDPLFLSASDFHIQSGSPAKDAGTSTGMPAGRTADICNGIAQLHGLPVYQNCNGIQNAIWDIGAHEFVASVGGAKRRGLLKVGSRNPYPACYEGD